MCVSVFWFCLVLFLRIFNYFMKEKKISVSETSVFRNFWACTFGFLGFLKNTFLYICIMDME